MFRSQDRVPQLFELKWQDGIHRIRGRSDCHAADGIGVLEIFGFVA